jgi:hypothetical protein
VLVVRLTVVDSHRLISSIEGYREEELLIEEELRASLIATWAGNGGTDCIFCCCIRSQEARRISRGSSVVELPSKDMPPP